MINIFNNKIFTFIIISLAGFANAWSLASYNTGEPSWRLQIISAYLLARFMYEAANNKKSISYGFYIAFIYTFFWLIGTFYWLYVSMHTYGGLNSALAILAVMALAGFLSLYYAVAFAGFSYILNKKNLIANSGVLIALLFAASFTLAEIARASWFTGFGWGAAGYAHVTGPLSYIPRYAGVYGAGFIALFISGLIAGIHFNYANKLTTKNKIYFIALLFVLLIIFLSAKGKSNAFKENNQTDKISVSLLQGNISQDEKFIEDIGIADALSWYGSNLYNTNAELTITPETALPILPSQMPEGYWTGLIDRFKNTPKAALIGVPLGNYKSGYTNSVIGISSEKLSNNNYDDILYKYDKHHLVPFGEFIPPFFRFFVNMMNIPLGDFERGGINQASFNFKNQRLAVNICYEDLFGEELATRFLDKNKAPTAFINMSNIAWFGNTVAIDQHLLISQMRALEFERPVIRSTNTGATAIINASGKVDSIFPKLTRGILKGEFEGKTHLTPFAIIASKYGLLPLWIICIFIILIGFLKKNES